ncbi:hypothetical protein [Polaromonas aquatica]|uniref:DUF2786 domain-containing protein n=2 Tax=Polaromonas TaxID=52972 RepID=A0ABW1U2Q6_9BURK
MRKPENMSREKVRAMKRAIVAFERPEPSCEEESAARACAAALLDRSIEYGHARLAVLRLAVAARIGADISAAHWDYCFSVTADCNDPGLQQVFSKALSQAKGVRQDLLPKQAQPRRRH